MLYLGQFVVRLAGVGLVGENLLYDEGHFSEGGLGLVETDEFAFVEGGQLVDCGFEVVLDEFHGKYLLHVWYYYLLFEGEY